MKRSAACALVIALLVGLPVIVCAQSQASVSSETFEEWMSKLSNWGRWGDDDQLGTLNLITPAKRVTAARSIENGISISLARDLEKTESLHNFGVPYPFKHQMNYTGLEPSGGTFSGDSYWIRYHGLAHSHLDALCHVFHEGRMYNGRDQTTVTDEGCEELSILGSSQGFFTRGVLIDIAWLEGVPYLEPGTAILPEDLDAWSAKAGVQIGPGDVVLVRTGRWARLDEKGPWNFSESLAGLHASSVEWLKARDVSAVGIDGGVDVLPSGVEGQWAPVHKLLLVAMGTLVFENLDLEELSVEAKRHGRWEFLFIAVPLRVPGGTGSPINPIAVF